MEDEPVATAIQNMLKGSKWLSAFLESYRPPLDLSLIHISEPTGRGTLPDGQGGGGNAPGKPPHLAGVSQQQDAALYPSGR